jgi:hypothetical protein
MITTHAVYNLDPDMGLRCKRRIDLQRLEQLCPELLARLSFMYLINMTTGIWEDVSLRP